MNCRNNTWKDQNTNQSSRNKSFTIGATNMRNATVVIETVKYKDKIKHNKYKPSEGEPKTYLENRTKTKKSKHQQ